MRATKVMDIISRLPGCAGQAADAVSAYTQIKMEDAPKLLKILKTQTVQTFGHVYHDRNGLNHGPAWKTQSVLLNEICMVILQQAGKKQNVDPMWRILMKEVDLGEPTSFLDHVYLGCNQ